MINTLFYKYVDLEPVQRYKEAQEKITNNLELNGKILVSEEGINGNLTGPEQDVKKYQDWLLNQPEFKNIQFKDTETQKHNFTRMIVKVRDEIITTRHDEEKQLVEKRAPHLEPEEFEDFIENKDDLVIVDARNNYEYDEGRFKDAIHLDIDKFSEWFKETQKLEQHKDKTIVTYCTGGIRCEKASAHLKEKGFENVYQLHGGILRYGQKKGGKHWEGNCFVFDKRHSIPIDPQKQGDDAEQIENYEPYKEKKSAKN